jgi:zinc transport system substrate-binding protein
MKLPHAALLAGTAFATVTAMSQITFAQEDGVAVVASIKPVHSLVAAVMEGVGTPTLVVQGAGSPHTYAMRPSDAAALQDADLIFWVGEGLENFLTAPLSSLAEGSQVVALSEAHDIVTLPYREGGAFDEHGHDDDAPETAGHHHDHGDDHHDREEHSGSDHGHDHGSHDHAGHDHAGHDHAGNDHTGHDHGAYDMHIWLDPENAKAMVHAIEEALAAADPANADAYAANAEAVTARLDALISETSAELAPLADRPFIVFHDAYQYLENRFSITAAGSITVSPENVPGAQRVAEMQERVRNLDATCVFAEPQFEPRIVSVVIEGTDAKAGVLDPLGADLEDGPELYFELIRNMTTSLVECLGEPQ